VLNSPDEQSKMERRNLETGKSMMWETVGAQYRELFIDFFMNNGNNNINTDRIMSLSDRKVEVAG